MLPGKGNFIRLSKNAESANPQLLSCPILKHVVFANPSLLLDVIVNIGDRGDLFGVMSPNLLRATRLLERARNAVAAQSQFAPA
jgi:hypothetical protein